MAWSADTKTNKWAAIKLRCKWCWPPIESATRSLQPVSWESNALVPSKHAHTHARSHTHTHTHANTHEHREIHTVTDIPEPLTWHPDLHCVLLAQCHNSERGKLINYRQLSRRDRSRAISSGYRYQKRSCLQYMPNHAVVWELLFAGSRYKSRFLVIELKIITTLASSTPGPSVHLICSFVRM